VLRAVSYGPGGLPSRELVQSYFIAEKSTLPLLSLVIEPRYLYDDEIGIYTVGKNGATQPGWCGGPKKANYFRHWYRAAHLEYFDEGKKPAFSLFGAVKIGGHCTKVLPQKSFTVKIRKRYGPKLLKYRLFKDRKIDEFRSFSLRNSGNDWCHSMLRDAFMQRLAEGMDLSTQAARPILLFINGKYWGLYNLREKINTAFLKSHYHTGKVDLLENNMTVKSGSASAYRKLMAFIGDHDLAEDNNYKVVSSQIDIDQLIDYLISEIYFANNDWPGSNIFFWRPRDRKGARWRWILHDTDFGFDLDHKNGAGFNMLELATRSDGPSWPNPPWSTFLLRHLLRNDGFRQRFVQRSMMRLDTVYAPKRVIETLDRMAAAIEAEIPRQYARWSTVPISESIRRKYPPLKTLAQWHAEIERMRNFAKQRRGFVEEHFREKFGLSR
jgi:hypothetical protein